MESTESSRDPDVRRRLSELAGEVAQNRADIDALRLRADESKVRADASESRADRARIRADASESRAEDDRLRINALETRADVDRETIRSLEAEGLITREHATNLEEALRSSRTIGAAIGIIMASRKVGETDAFAVLVRASQNMNRKVRVLADDIVETGDVSQLPIS